MRVYQSVLQKYYFFGNQQKMFSTMRKGGYRLLIMSMVEFLDQKMKQRAKKGHFR